MKFNLKARPSGEKGSLIVIKENGKIKMKEVFKDYGTLWKVELEPAKVILTLIGSHTRLSLANTNNQLQLTLKR